jgi:hypothetical protein
MRLTLNNTLELSDGDVDYAHFRENHRKMPCIKLKRPILNCCMTYLAMHNGLAILVHTGPPFWRILGHRTGANPFIISICGTTFVSGINIRDSVTNNFITNNVITNKFIMYLY